MAKKTATQIAIDAALVDAKMEFPFTLKNIPFTSVDLSAPKAEQTKREHRVNIIYSSFQELVRCAARKTIIDCGNRSHKEEGFPTNRVVTVDAYGKFTLTEEDKEDLIRHSDESAREKRMAELKQEMALYEKIAAERIGETPKVGGAPTQKANGGKK